MAQHLVIQLARFGDIVQTKRLLLSLAAKPEATVHLAVDRSMAALAAMVYPFAVVHPLLCHAETATAADVLAHNRAAFADLGSVSFASVYNLNFSGLSLALAGLFNPDIIRGYSRRDGQDLRSRWCRMAFRWTGQRRAAPLNLVDFWAHLHPDPVPASTVNPAARLPEKGAGHGKMAVVLAGRQARRSLPPDVLAPVAEAAFAALGGPEIILIGSDAERPLARQLARNLARGAAGRLVDRCGGTSLTDLAEIFSGCDLVLTPDTGAMHLAAHCGAAVQAFFLSSAWCFETGPYGEGHTIWQATRDCAPCVESTPCPHAVACLAPFREPGFLAAVRGKIPEQWPEGLARLTGAVDNLGMDYAPAGGALTADSPEMKRRAALRALLAAYLGCGENAGRPVPTWAAEELLHESDWALAGQGADAPFEAVFGG